MDIYDDLLVPLSYGVSLLLGADIVSALNLDIGTLILVDLTNQGKDATAETLGTDVVLVHLSRSELAETQVEPDV